MVISKIIVETVVTWVLVYNVGLMYGEPAYFYRREAKTQCQSTEGKTFLLFKIWLISLHYTEDAKGPCLNPLLFIKSIDITPITHTRAFSHRGFSQEGIQLRENRDHRLTDSDCWSINISGTEMSAP